MYWRPNGIDFSANDTLLLDNLSLHINRPHAGEDLSHYIADVRSYSDYYPFGMEMSGRNGNTGEYRFGFNGMEKDDETYNESGTAYDFGARIYSSRLGRWLSTDPLYDIYPGWSPYRAFLDNPVIYEDPQGATEYLTIIIKDDQLGKTTTIQKIVSNDVFKSGERNASNYNNSDTYEETVYRDKNTTLTIHVNRDGSASASAPVTELTDVALSIANPIGESEFLVNVGVDIDDFETEGDGGDIGGGWNIIADSDGASPTKFKSEHAEQLDDAVIALMGGFGAGRNKEKSMDAVKGSASQIVNIISEWSNAISNIKRDFKMIKHDLNKGNSNSSSGGGNYDPTGSTHNNKEILKCGECGKTMQDTIWHNRSAQHNKEK